MRKRYKMGILAVMAVIATACFWYFSRQGSVLLETAGELPQVLVRMAQSENRVRLWMDEEAGEGYFFLPACVTHQKIRLGNTGENSVRIDGKLYGTGDVFTWEASQSYELQITDSAYDSHTYRVRFMKSENLPSIFIDTPSGSLAYLHADRENEETGEICVVRADGATEYQDQLLRISGRGNSSWGYEKKPYALKLKENRPLCGLKSGDRWRLLALWREGSRMGNKVAMDMAGALGLPYSMQGTWVDLYLNGEYRGIYLLTESVTVGEGRVDIYDLEKENKRENPSIRQGTAKRYEEEDNKGYLLQNGDDISGGYLIEKDHPKHYEKEANGFVTSWGNQFTVKAPGHASREQVAYIQDYMEGIDRQIQNGDSVVWERLDLLSFARRFLVDEIAMDPDTGVTSMYFYKDRGDDKIYSSPPWDYDSAFGVIGGGEGYYVNYGETIVNNNERLGTAANWYQKLYETPELYQCIVEEYEKILPYCEKLLGTEIDRYADRIRASATMDDARWESVRGPGDDSPRYVSFDANVNYMKFFIANRLNCLCARWNVPHEPFRAPASGEMHQVTFSVYEGVVETIQVPDGETISDLPEYDASLYQGWGYKKSGEPFSNYIPIYEDMEMYNAKWE